MTARASRERAVVSAVPTQKLVFEYIRANELTDLVFHVDAKR